MAELRKMVWHAQWIWSAEAGDPRFSVRYFRRSFEVAEAAGADLTLHVSADSRYRLYLNGQPVGRGPARGDLDHYNFETYRLGGQVRKGRNVLAVQVMAYGNWGPIAEMHSETGGLVVQGGVRTASGFVKLDTDERWRVLCDRAYAARMCGPRGYFAVNPLEEVSGSEYPWGWQEIEFDDAEWEEPRLVGQASGRHQSGHPRHRWRLVPREIAALREEEVFASDVVASPRREELLGLLRPGGGRAVEVAANTEVEWTVYMGKLFTGYPELRASGGRGSEVELAYTEALTRDGKKGRRDDLTFGTVEDDSPSDIYRPGGGRAERWQPLWYRCGRFMRLRVRTGAEALRLEGLGFDFTCYPFEERGSFDSDDPELRAIWDLSWHTALCCAHEHYEDCPFWEQLQYLSDTRLQILISYNVAGDDTLARAAIRAFDTSRLYEGLTQSRYPSRLEQIIPGFSLYYIMMVEDHWEYFGDLELLRRVTPGIGSVLGWFDRHVGADGLVGYVPWWAFVDWCPEWKDGVPPEAYAGASTTINLQVVAALGSAARLARALGDEYHAEVYDRRAESLRQAIRRHAWSEREGLFLDGPGSGNLSQHSNVWAILTETATAEQTGRIMERLLDDGKLSKTTYIHDYYLFQALLKVGAVDRLEQVIGRWRGMLHYGFSTCPENPEPVRSDCHAWSAWPMFEFQRVLLGVRAATPGFASVEIAPQPFGQVTEAWGRVPTCRGEIAVAWKRRGERMGLSARVPEGMAAVVRLPDGSWRRFEGGGGISFGDADLLGAAVLK